MPVLMVLEAWGGPALCLVSRKFWEVFNRSSEFWRPVKRRGWGFDDLRRCRAALERRSIFVVGVGLE